MVSSLGLMDVHVTNSLMCVSIYLNSKAMKRWFLYTYLRSGYGTVKQGYGTGYGTVKEGCGIGYGTVKEGYGTRYGWTSVRYTRTWVLYSPTCVWYFQTYVWYSYGTLRPGILGNITIT